jgi:DNA-binding transcriptional ArsR family regulator
MNEWSVEKLRISGAAVEANEQARRAKRRRQSGNPRIGAFIAGPIPVVWLKRARDLGLQPLWLGLVLWHLRGLTRSRSCVVSNVMMNDWGIPRSSKSRALSALERAGLIAVKRQGRRSPRVTLVMLEMVEEGEDAR